MQRSRRCSSIGSSIFWARRPWPWRASREPADGGPFRLTVKVWSVIGGPACTSGDHAPSHRQCRVWECSPPGLAISLRASPACGRRAPSR